MPEQSSLGRVEHAVTSAQNGSSNHEPVHTALSGEELADRRRPGRTEAISLLLPMLRQPTRAPPSFGETPSVFPRAEVSDDSADRSDSLSPARGICIGMAIALVLWAVLLIGAWRLFWH